jgi:CRP/FNR family transcriptional regulator, dissimilatory nitrate respiration regulator
VADPRILETLARAAHLAALTPEALERVAAIATLRAYDAGRTVFVEGEPARAFFVVRSGAVRLYRIGPDGRTHVLHHLRAGQSFAEAAVTTFRRYPACAEATGRAELVEVAGEPFLRLLADDPSLARAMIGALCQHLVRLVARVDELSAATAGARLARYLLRLPARGADASPRVELPTAKKDLAETLSIAPETLSRILRRWSDRGLVAVQGRRIVLREPRVLEAIAEGLPPAP